VEPLRALVLDPGAQALAVAGALTAVAAIAHLACIAIGAPAYRLMGAGDRMARAVEAGKIRPTVVTLAIASVLLICAVYAFSGAGITPRLPFTRIALLLVSAAFLTRALAFPLLKPLFPENSTTFWLVSSGVCLALGLLYAAGVVARWAQL
jgi:hypothetical protein